MPVMSLTGLFQEDFMSGAWSELWIEEALLPATQEERIILN